MKPLTFPSKRQLEVMHPGINCTSTEYLPVINVKAG